MRVLTRSAEASTWVIELAAVESRLSLILVLRRGFFRGVCCWCCWGVLGTTVSRGRLRFRTFLGAALVDAGSWFLFDFRIDCSFFQFPDGRLASIASS